MTLCCNCVDCQCCRITAPPAGWMCGCETEGCVPEVCDGTCAWCDSAHPKHEAAVAAFDRFWATGEAIDWSELQ